MTRGEWYTATTALLNSIYNRKLPTLDWRSFKERVSGAVGGAVDRAIHSELRRLHVLLEQRTALLAKAEERHAQAEARRIDAENRLQAATDMIVKLRVDANMAEERAEYKTRGMEEALKEKYEECRELTERVARLSKNKRLAHYRRK